MSVPREDLVAAHKYGHLVDGLAQHYRNPYTGHPLTGQELLLKLAKGESTFNSKADSGRAKGRTQFTPGSRKIAMDKFGIDPWASTDGAYHAAALHLLGKINGSKGLSGYNPGDPHYPAYILGQKIGPVRGKHGSGGYTPAQGAQASQGGLTPPEGSGSDSGTAALLAALTGSQGASIPGPSLPLPSIPKLTAEGAPQYQAPELSDPVERQREQLSSAPNLAALLAAIRTPGGDVPQLGGTAPASGGSGGSAGEKSAPAANGRVIYGPGSIRAGVKPSKLLTRFLDQVSVHARSPIKVGTATNHNRLTVDGNVSDHWDGHAADIPVPYDSKKGDLGAAHALVAAGVPWKKALAMARKGGLFNIRPTSGPFKGHRVQVIWRTNIGGNHHDHYHVGVR